MERFPCVYILSNLLRSVLYIGVTSNLSKRLESHQKKDLAGFSKKYSVDRLLYAESYETMIEAILREKQIKRWSRKKKEWLITQMNPDWNDLNL